MMKNDKYGLMNYPDARPAYNVGDYIQSLAAKQYLPKVDYFINREGLSDFQSDQVKMIMNGFYMESPSNWPPSNLIDPLFVSMHINATAKDLMLQDKGVNYFKSQERPIGCRDKFTTQLLQDRGIDAYYTGCLTTTLDLKYKSNNRTNKIYIVDPFYYNPSWEKLLAAKSNFVKGVLNGEILQLGVKKKLLNKVFKKDILKEATYINHWITKENHTEPERFSLAEELLKKYSSAKLVITSRIHCALPCLALGTPVIFLNYGLDIDKSLCRLDGVIELFNVINFDEKGNIDANFDLPANKIGTDFEISNPDRHHKLAAALKEKCKQFIYGE